MSFKLHYNKVTNKFTIRNAQRNIVTASEPCIEMPLVGTVVTLAPRVHILVTRKELESAKSKHRPVLTATVTRFPFVRLLVKRLKEFL